MILEYIDAAMRKATYEFLPDDKVYYGEISGFDGVYASAEHLEECRDELKATLEDWLLLSISKNLSVPIINGLAPEIKMLPDGNALANV